MKRYAAFTIRGAEEELNILFSIAHGIAKEVKLISGTLYIDDLDEEAEEYRQIEAILKERGFLYSFAELREYTKNEMKSAQFYEMRIIYPWETDGKIAEEFGTGYERTCSACNYGRKQRSLLRVNTKKIGRYDIVSLPPEIIINERLRLILEESDITGYTLQPVIDTRGVTEPVFHQLVINSTLPALSDHARFEIDENLFCEECESCGRALRSEMIYETSKMNHAKDINLSKEGFGFSNQCQPSVVVSKKIYDLFQVHKVKRVLFEPVRLI